MPGELDNKRLVVTGAAGGIGRATCTPAASESARVVAVDVAETAEETAQIIRAAGGEALAVRADVSDEAAVAGFLQRGIDEGRIGQINPTRRAGQPVEIAQMACFLLSDRASYVNGQAIAVDGGLSTSHPLGDSEVMSGRRHHRQWPAAWLVAGALALAACGPTESDRHAAESAEAAATEGTPSPGDPTPLPPEAPRERPSGEILLAEPPPGWVETGALQTPALRMAEYGPPDETEGRLERITFEAQTGQPLPDPIEFVLAVARDLNARCNAMEDINVSSGLENGYPTSVRLMICPEFEDSPHGQVVMAKAIQGNDEFYVVTRRLRVPPMQGQGQPLTAQEMAEWSTHLKGVQACDTRANGEHACPEQVTAAPVDYSP